MTIKETIKTNGWGQEYDYSAPYRCINVCIDFINSDGCEDETEFTISPFNVKELTSLYNDFCKENQFKTNTVYNIYISGFCKTMEEAA